MTWICAKLTERIQILIPSQTPNEDGGFDFGFGIPFGEGFDLGPFDYLAPVLTIWAGFKPSRFAGRGGEYLRGQQINESVTHEFMIRKSAVASLGKGFGDGFAMSFDSMEDLAPLQSNYFIFVQRGSTVKGRLFRIHNVIDNNEEREYLRVFAEEIEERGTGYPA